VAKKVLVMMGSISDLDTMLAAKKTLTEFGVVHEMRVISAHRTPEVAAKTARNAKKNGYGAIICAAGLAAHLAGAVAAQTTLPVIGVPMPAGPLAGQDSLLATVQMPPGIPVATVGIGNAKNAALLAIQILAVSDDKLAQKLVESRRSMAASVKKADKKLQTT
jgi:5-(carboxyamino)imidazole ribonucleotide mutase